MQKKLTYLLIIFALVLAFNTVEAACNWKNRLPVFHPSDSCNTKSKKASVNGYLGFQTSSSCFKYTWKVNGNVVGSSNNINYPITKNGSYTISVTVRDTCNNCDTTFTSTRTVSCLTNCNWKAKNLSILGGDSCNQYPYKPSIKVFLYGSTSCAKYTWKVNGKFVSNGVVLVYKATQNGTYNLSVTVSDTCNKCDTTYTSSVNITCASSCKWFNRNLNFSTWDSCSGIGSNKVSINGEIGPANGCYKYAWILNGYTVQYGSRFLNMGIGVNGNYTLCLKITDTCNKCDTTLCQNFTVTCVPKACNWKGKNATLYINDSCSNSPSSPSFGNYLYFQNNSSKCLKYTFKVNGNTIYSGNNPYKSYFPKQNGTYTVTVNVRDTCNNCDTTYTGSINITCASSCKWFNRNLKFSTWDSCNGRGPNKFSINGEIGPANGCYRYAWIVNGYTVQYGSRILNMGIGANGTYNLCVKITDTCNKCDTTLCRSFNITCLPKACNWKGKNATFYIVDSCSNNSRNPNFLNYLYFQNNSSKCLKYTWKVNGSTIYSGTNPYSSYAPKQNGTYNVTVNVRDTCTNCDTTYSKSINVTCAGNCNWKSRNLSLSAKDSCNKSYNSAYITSFITISNNSCLKYLWKVNGVVKSNSYYFNYPVYTNGQYTVCLTLTDTCLKCDTSLCFTKTITCLSSCNWKSRNPYTYAWDSCKGNYSKLNAYVSFNYNRASCFKYSWTVNGKSAGSGNIMSYPITQNGTYSICVKALDTCNKCDTTMCFSKTINCFSACNWKSRISANNYYDSCNGVGYANSLNGYVAMNQNYKTSCYKYRWTVNGAYVGNKNYFHTPIYLNGAYNVCVKITDTCNKCDTTICSRRVVNCNNLGLKNNSLNVVKIYPNPASNNINIESSQVSEYTEILSIEGKAIWTGKLEEGINNIVTDQWARGIYIVRIKTVSGISNYKITLE